jgi:hypothetical protein
VHTARQWFCAAKRVSLAGAAGTRLPVVMGGATIGLMCGRYASFLPAEYLARLFATMNPPPNLNPTWNMAPTMDAPTVRLARPASGTSTY